MKIIRKSHNLNSSLDIIVEGGKTVTGFNDKRTGAVAYQAGVPPLKFEGGACYKVDAARDE